MTRMNQFTVIGILNWLSTTPFNFRISRIFNASKRTAKRPSFISPQSQLIFCSGLVFVQILVNVIWFLLEPPEAVYHHPTREDNMLVCQVS